MQNVVLTTFTLLMHFQRNHEHVFLLKKTCVWLFTMYYIQTKHVVEVLMHIIIYNKHVRTFSHVYLVLLSSKYIIITLNSLKKRTFTRNKYWSILFCKMTFFFNSHVSGLCLRYFKRDYYVKNW